MGDLLGASNLSQENEEYIPVKVWIIDKIFHAMLKHVYMYLGIMSYPAA